MAAFKFRLAPVLNLRARMKDEKQWELRELNETRQRMVAQIAVLESELRDTGEVLAGHEGTLLSAIDLKLHSEHAELIDRRLKEKSAAAAQLDGAIVEKRGELVEALRGLKSLQRLRERQAEKFQRDQDAAEQKFADEVAQRKFVAGHGRNKLP